MNPLLNTKFLLLAATAFAATIMIGSTVVAPAFASSSSTHEFHHDVKHFLHCVRNNGNTHISKHHFANCLTDNFNIHISKHTEKHL